MKLYGEVFPVEIIHPHLADCEMIMSAGEGMKDFCKVLYRRTRAYARRMENDVAVFGEPPEKGRYEKKGRCVKKRKDAGNRWVNARNVVTL